MPGFAALLGLGRLQHRDAGLSVRRAMLFASLFCVLTVPSTVAALSRAFLVCWTKEIVMKVRVLLVVIALIATPVLAQEGKAFERGTPDLKSARALAFSPSGVLFVGDATGAAVFAFDFKEPETAIAEAPSVADLDGVIAGLLGTTPRDILIDDMAVHPTSKAVYLAVSRSTGKNVPPAIVRVGSGDSIEIKVLDNVRFAKASLARAPGADAKDRRGRSLRAQAITDMKFHDGRLYVAGLSNEEFSSSLRSLRFPFGDDQRFSTVEIYHGAHGQFETHAPIRTFLPLELEGVQHMIASYTCTPLVTLPLESLADGEHVKGKTVAELGFGNAPLDMVAIEKDGKTYVLMVNNRRGGMKIDAADIVKAGAITSEVDGVLAGVPFEPLAMANVLKLADYGEQIVIVQRDKVSGKMELRAFPKRWI